MGGIGNYTDSERESYCRDILREQTPKEDKVLEGIKCPYCNESMRLIMGNQFYTYWLCTKCEKEFEYNVHSETFSNEVTAKKELLDTVRGTQKILSKKDSVEKVKENENKMFNLFKPKKIYCVRWIDEDKDTCQDIVRAKDIAEAWNKIKQGYGWRAVYCISIVEVADEDFNMKEK